MEHKFLNIYLCQKYINPDEACTAHRMGWFTHYIWLMHVQSFWGQFHICAYVTKNICNKYSFLHNISNKNLSW